MAVIFSSAILAFYGCGGGGSGGGATTEKTPASLTSSNASTAAAGLIQALSLSDVSGIAGTAAAGLDGKESGGKKGPLREILDTTLSLVNNERVVGARAPGSGSQTTGCAGVDGIEGTADDSGTKTVSASWSDKTATDVKDLSGSVTYSNCVEGSTTFNGTASIAFTGWLSAPTGITLTANMTSVDTKGTSTVTDDDNLTLTNLTMSLTGITRNQTTGEIASATMSITGTISGMESGDAVNLGFDALTMTFSSSASGETVSISGSLYVPCVGGWVTITTVTPVFTPAGSSCPDDGDVKIASGGNTVEVVFEAGCNVAVTFNGTAGFRNFTGLKGLCN